MMRGEVGSVVTSLAYNFERGHRVPHTRRNAVPARRCAEEFLHPTAALSTFPRLFREVNRDFAEVSRRGVLPTTGNSPYASARARTDAISPACDYGRIARTDFV